MKRHKQEKTTLSDRGKPVAVLVSGHEFARLRGESQGFWETYQKFRQEVGLDRLGITPSTLRSLRNRTPGRQVKL